MKNNVKAEVLRLTPQCLLPFRGRAGLSVRACRCIRVSWSSTLSSLAASEARWRTGLREVGPAVVGQPWPPQYMCACLHRHTHLSTGTQMGQSSLGTLVSVGAPDGGWRLPGCLSELWVSGQPRWGHVPEPFISRVQGTVGSLIKLETKWALLYFLLGECVCNICYLKRLWVCGAVASSAAQPSLLSVPVTLRLWNWARHLLNDPSAFFLAPSPWQPPSVFRILATLSTSYKWIYTYSLCPFLTGSFYSA